MSGRDGYRIFVGGLSWDITERRLEDTFSRFGKIIDSQIMIERDTGRPRGFGFITFSDRRAMEDSIRDMHGRELGDRTISVNKAQAKMNGEDGGGGGGQRYSAGYPPGGGRSNYDRSGGGGQDECFKCGQSGHWARECPSAGGGRGSQSSSSRSRSGGGRGDRYVDDRYDAGSRYGERERERESRYSSRSRNGSDRYASGGFGKESSEGRYKGGRVEPYALPTKPIRQASFERY